MQRAFIAGILVAFALGWLGVFIVSRKISFFGDGIAHASLAGIALALLLGLAPLPVVLLLGIMLAGIMYLVEEKTTLSSDSILGIIFTTGMALGVVLMHYYPGYQPELMSYLFGNILAITHTDLIYTLAITSLVGIVLSTTYRSLTFATIDPDGAYLAGISLRRHTLGLYIMTALTIMVSVKLIGIILVSALLIIPTVTARSIARSFATLQLYSILIALMIVIVGLVASFYLDLPSGATIVLTGTTFFIISICIPNRISRS